MASPPLSQIEIEALGRIVRSPVWQSAEQGAQSEMIRQTVPGFGKLDPVMQDVLVSGFRRGQNAPPSELGTARKPGTVGRAPFSFEPLRQTLIGGGAVLGGTAGLLGGTAFTPPATPLSVGLGSAVGAAGGRATAEALAALGRITPLAQVMEFGEPLAGLSLATVMTSDALWELATFGAAVGAPIAKRPLKTLAKSRLTLEELSAAERAAERGIPVGFQEVSQGFLGRFSQPMLGVLPGFVGPFRKAFQRRATKQQRSVLRFIEGIGPRTLTEPEISRGAVASAKGRMSHVYDVLDSAFNGVYKQMESNGLLVTMDETKEAAKSYLGTLQKEALPQILKGEEGEEVIKKVARTSIATKLADRILKAPDTISVSEYRGLLGEIDRAIESSKKLGYDVKNLVRMKGDLVEGLGSNLSGDPSTVSYFKTRYESLRAIWGQAKDLSESPSARRVPGRLAFRSQESKGVVEDLFFDASIRDWSPDSMRDLRRLLGGDSYRAVVTRRVETALESARVSAKEAKTSARDPLSFSDAKKLTAEFGLDDPKGVNFQAWKHALEPLGVSMRDVKGLTEAIATANRHAEPLAAQLAKRRVALAGARGAIGAILPTAGYLTAGAPGGIAFPLASYLMIRNWGKIVTDPYVLRELTRQIREETAIAKGFATRAVVDRARASGARKLIAARAMNLVASSVGQATEGVPDDISLTPEQTVPVPMIPMR